MIRVSIVEDVEDPARGSTMLINSNFCLPSTAMIKFRLKLDHNLQGSIPIYFLEKECASCLVIGAF